jgi:glutaredoxin 3
LQKGIKYQEFDVAANAEAAKEMMKVSGARSVPVITVDGEVIIGFDQVRLDEALRK